MGLQLERTQPTLKTEHPWHDDRLKRADLAGRLTQIVKNTTQPMTVSLHGDWGTGKTFFLKRWQAQLEADGMQAVYVDAWANDHMDDPFITMLGQMNEGRHQGKLQAVWKTVVEKAGPLLGNIAKAQIAHHTGITIDTSGKETLLDTYTAANKAKSQLQEEIGKYAGEVLSETGYPLVLLIDELDRCRPDYAVSMLEAVKHVLQVPGTVTLFGLNRNQLEHCLKSRYGEIDTDIYLRKFFNLQLRLPDADQEAFCNGLMEEYGVADAFATAVKNRQYFRLRRLREMTLDTAAGILIGLGLSARELDECVRTIALALWSRNEQEPFIPEVTIPLVVAKVKSPEIYRKFHGNGRFARELVDMLWEYKNPGEQNHGRTEFVQWGIESCEISIYCCEQMMQQEGEKIDPLQELEKFMAGDVAREDLFSTRTLERYRNRPSLQPDGAIAHAVLDEMRQFADIRKSLVSRLDLENSKGTR